jgi:hypothetical protein
MSSSDGPSHSPPLNGSDDNHEAALHRRLSKALETASNFKSKALMEKEVNKELARRNEEVRAKNRTLDKQLDDIKDLLGCALNQLQTEPDTKQQQVTGGKDSLLFISQLVAGDLVTLCDRLLPVPLGCRTACRRRRHWQDILRSR